MNPGGGLNVDVLGPEIPVVSIVRFELPLLPAARYCINRIVPCQYSIENIGPMPNINLCLKYMGTWSPIQPSLVGEDQEQTMKCMLSLLPSGLRSTGNAR